MTMTSAQLRAALLEGADRHPTKAVPSHIGERPVFILAPNSELGKRYVPMLLAKAIRPVAVVDDLSAEETLHGVPRWSAFKFAQKAAATPGAIAIDFSVGRFSSALFGRLAAEAGVERIDMVGALAEFSLPGVFESVPDTRRKTVENIDRFLALGERLADEQSKVTLYSALLMRTEYDRKHLQNCLISGEDEYFCAAPTGKTFRLADDEAFCDAGAHIGLVTTKFLGATNWRYKSIHAFEPDRINYKALGKMRLLPLHEFHTRNKAVSDRDETLSFVESGTVSSYIAATGGQQCQTVKLDDELPCLSFLKMDIEGFEARALRGAERLIRRFAPRMAITAYHYPLDMLDIVDTLDSIREGYVLRMRQHYNYFYDTILYASPEPGWDPKPDTLAA